jgi:tRNA1(Val) A37 N6-methylase TrmN6
MKKRELVEDANYDETALLGGKLRLFQPRSGYRTAIDPVLLAAAISPKPGDVLAELGMGSGAVSLCLAARVPECRILGLELQPELAEAARLGVIANGFEPRISVHLGDVNSPPADFGEKSFDHVFFNPPYGQAESGTLPPNPSKRIAHAEKEDDLGQWIKSAHFLLKNKGRLTVIHRADRLADIMRGLQNRFGGVEIFPLWPKLGEAAKRVVVRARKGSRSPLILHAGLVLHEKDGEFTQEAEAVLRDGAGLFP